MHAGSRPTKPAAPTQTNRAKGIKDGLVLILILSNLFWLPLPSSKSFYHLIMHFIIALTALLPAFLAVQALPASNIASSAVPVTNRPPALDHVTFNNDTDGRITFNKGAPNGLYIYHNATHFSYHGEADTSAPKLRRVQRVLFVQSQLADTSTGHSASDGLDRRQTSCDVSCTGGVLSSDDTTNAINGLANMFGDGLGWSGAIAYNQGDVSAFGCDYGNGQSYTAAQYHFDINCISSVCGLTNVISWNSHKSWKATYGVNLNGFSCH
jgi:hypothetical protein